MAEPQEARLHQGRCDDDEGSESSSVDVDSSVGMSLTKMPRSGAMGTSLKTKGMARGRVRVSTDASVCFVVASVCFGVASVCERVTSVCVRRGNNRS